MSFQIRINNPHPQVCMQASCSQLDEDFHLVNYEHRIFTFVLQRLTNFAKSSMTRLSVVYSVFFL